MSGNLHISLHSHDIFHEHMRHYHSICLTLVILRPKKRARAEQGETLTNHAPTAPGAVKKAARAGARSVANGIITSGAEECSQGVILAHIRIAD